MSVYKKGDKREDDEPKKNELEKGLDALGKGMEDMAKGISSLFGGGSKDKKWEKKGGGHTLGTAADAEAARQARMASLDKAGAASSSSTPRQPARPPPPAAAAAIAAAEARAAGGNQPRRAPSAPAAPAVERGPSGASGGFAGPGRTTQAPEAKYASEITMLQEMGFRADAAVRTLVACNGDIEQAVSVLSADESAASMPGGGGGGAAAAAVERMAMLAEASEASAEHAPALGMALAGMRGGGACLGIIRKLIGNVRDHPDDPKYRKVRLTNPKIAEALGGLLEGLALLSACGFTFDATGEYAEMSDAGAAATAALEAACTALDEAIACAASGGPPVPVGPFDVKVIAC
eukprot:jgi/Chrpa1/12859/Chrysochromulina_OHIO_Genome00001039-RA